MNISSHRSIKWGYLLGLPAWTYAAGALLRSQGLEVAAALMVPLRCPINWLTGLLCPTCGLGRSVVMSFGGRWQQALELHFLGPPLAVFAVVLWLFVLFNRCQLLFGILSPFLGGRSPRPSSGAGLAVVLVLGLWGLLRNF